MSDPQPTPWAKLARTSPGAWVTLEGWLAPLAEPPSPGYGLLVSAPDCCAGCPPHPDTTIEVLGAQPLPQAGRPVTLAGRWQPLPADDPTGWRFQLAEARALPSPPPGPWLPRRRALAALPLACLGISLTGCATPMPDGDLIEARALLANTPAADLHSHAGGAILQGNRGLISGGLGPPMRAGGMRLVALAMVADAQLTQVVAGGRIRASREPGPGELPLYAERAFAHLTDLVAREGLGVVTNQASLAAALAPGAGPAAIVAAEGADFLQGQAGRLEDTFTRHKLRHLQLVHYRVNELGDIQTEEPVHQGLTTAGRDVVRECNRLGLVVDVAHASLQTVQGVAEASQRPIVLSHTSLNNAPPRNTRTIRTEHARLVAQTGGVIGVWPVRGIYPDIAAYAEGIARMVEAAGVAHVGLGTDMMGLPGGGSFGDYQQTPQVATALRRIGFSPAEVGQLMGGNFARVLGQVLPA